MKLLSWIKELLHVEDVNESTLFKYIFIKMWPALLIGSFLSLPISTGVKFILDNSSRHSHKDISDFFTSSIVPLNITSLIITIIFFIYIYLTTSAFILFDSDDENLMEDKVIWCRKLLITRAGISTLILILFFYMFAVNPIVNNTSEDGGAAAFLLFAFPILSLPIFYSPFSVSGIVTGLLSMANSSGSGGKHTSAIERLHMKYERDRRVETSSKKINEKKQQQTVEKEIVNLRQEVKKAENRQRKPDEQKKSSDYDNEKNENNIKIR